MKARGREAVKVEAFILIAFFSFVCLVAFDVSSQTEMQMTLPEKIPLTESLFSRGKMLYQKQCAVCHGVMGRGDGAAAYLLYPKPRDFKRNDYRLISTTEMEATDEDLFRTITRGMPGSSMPSWEFLSEKERRALVYYVRYLTKLGEKRARGEITDGMIEAGLSWDTQKELATSDVDPESVIRVPEEPPVNAESISNGRALFVKACAACHGLQGKGDGQQKMQDSLGYPLKPRALTNGIFKGASSSQELYYRFIAGLPGSPMPSYQGAFSEEQIWDLIHYVQTLPAPGARDRAHLNRRNIMARKTAEDLNLNPLASRWSKIDPVFVSLTPLWWRDERIEGIEVRAVHDGSQVQIHLSWIDATKDDAMVRHASFSDGVAIQLSGDKDPPLFAMGSAGAGVSIWHWKASWQKETKAWEDIETEFPHAATDFYESQTNYEYGSPFETKDSETKFHDPLFMAGRGARNPLSDIGRSSAAEEAQAEGFGSLTTIHPSIETVEVTGLWQDGRWHVVFGRTLRPSEKERIQFTPGVPINIAFAVWDGAQGDRNGQKMVSIWNELILEA